MLAGFGGGSTWSAVTVALLGALVATLSLLAALLGQPNLPQHHFYDGALAGMSANDISRLGRMLGESVIDVLIKGKAIRDVPVKTDPIPRIYVNIDTADRMGLQISYDFLNAVEIVR